MWSAEIALDHGFIFTDLPPDNEKTVLGDIFIFGRVQEKDYRRLHLAVQVDNVDGRLLLIHANPYDGVSIWPIDTFADKKRYERIYTIKRLIPPLFYVYIKPLL